MPTPGLLITILRELLTRDRCPRIPEPELVMDQPEQVAAYVRAGREDWIMAPTYLFHCAQMLDLVGPGDRVLDLACGPATLLALIAQSCPESHFIGTDLSTEMLAQAYRHLQELGVNNVTVQRGDMTDLEGFSDHSVDVVISTMSLHHLPGLEQLERTLREIARVLKPGGGIYLTDFARLKAEASMRYFAYQHAARQSEYFTLDYLNSLHAAFSVAELRAAVQRQLGTAARLYAMRPIPLMIVIRSAGRKPPDSLVLQDLGARYAALPPAQQRDYRDLTALFRLGGLAAPIDVRSGSARAAAVR